MTYRPLPLPRALRDGVETTTDLARSRVSLAVAVQHLWETAELLSGGLLAVAHYEGKLAMGYHLFVVTDALRALEHRLDELGTSKTVRRREHRALVDVAAVLATQDGDAVLRAVYQVLLPRAVELLRELHDAGGRVADAPTHRLVRLHLPELEEARDWGLDATALLDTGAPAAAVPDAAHDGARTRPVRARRDDRFAVFSDTRDYRADAAHDADASPYEQDRLELVRTNRDEIDAIETFALVYYDLLDGAPVDMLWDLARTAWDEVRHSLLGHQLLERISGDPFAYPCSMIGIEVRSRLGGWDALAQISLFGELNIIGPMRALAYAARAQGDEVTARAFDYICSDESLHLRRIRRWLKEQHPLGDLDEIERFTKRRAGALLEELGVMGEEYFVNLSSEQIFELLGE